MLEYKQNSTILVTDTLHTPGDFMIAEFISQYSDQLCLLGPTEHYQQLLKKSGFHKPIQGLDVDTVFPDKKYIAIDNINHLIYSGVPANKVIQWLMKLQDAVYEVHVIDSEKWYNYAAKP